MTDIRHPSMDIQTFCSFIVLFMSIIWPAVSGFNILVSSVYGEGSHFLAGAAVGQGLADKGHNVTVLISRAYEHRAKDPKYSNLSFLIFNHRNRSLQDVRDMFFHANTMAFDSAESQMLELFSLFSESMADDCVGVLHDVDIMKQLKGMDAIIMDPVWLCGVLMRAVIERNLNHSKQIKMISMTPNIPDGAMLQSIGSYFNSAFQPEISTGYTNRMTFLQRVTNIFFTSLTIILSQYIFIPPYQKVARNMGFDQQDLDLGIWTWHKLFDLHLINIHMSSDFPFPLSPNVILIGGGLTVRPPAKLDQVMTYSNSTDEGCIRDCLDSLFAPSILSL